MNLNLHLFRWTIMFGTVKRPGLWKGVRVIHRFRNSYLVWRCERWPTRILFGITLEPTK